MYYQSEYAVKLGPVGHQ